MKTYLCISISLFLLNGLSFAKDLAPTQIKFCYYNFREDIVTAAVVAGNSKNYFAEKNIKLHFLNEQGLKFNLKDIYETSYLKKGGSQFYYPGLAQEIELIHKNTARECDITSVNAEALLLNKNNDDVRLLAVYLYGGQYDSQLLVDKNSNIESVAALKGKTVRVGRILTQVILKKALESNGLTFNDVKTKKTYADGIQTALEKNEVQAVIAYNPTIPLLLASGTTKILKADIFKSYFKTALPSSILVTSKDFAKNHPQVLSDFMAAFRRSAKLIADNPEEVIYAMRSEQGNKMNYKYSNVQIEKAASLMSISEPVYFVTDDATKSALFSRNDVAAGFITLSSEFSALGLTPEKSSVSLEKIGE